MPEPIRHVIIVGGGTAGWFAASCLNSELNKENPTLKITVIESSEVGPVGVGEATTPSIRGFIYLLGIDEIEFMSRCNATYKAAIKFVNWHRNPALGQHHFWHPFSFPPPLGNENPFQYWLAHRANGFDKGYLESCTPFTSLFETRKSPVVEGKYPNSQGINYAYHFDAGVLGQFLKERQLKQGIAHMVDHITQVERDEKGFIQRLHTAQHGALEADLYVDCSGFKSLLLGETLQEPFMPFKPHLFCNRALVKRRPWDNTPEGPHQLNPYTTATAIGHGWVWDIPLFGQISTGYVYDGDMISQEQAEAEFNAHLGEAWAGIPSRSISIRVGRHRRQWVGNCVAIGLSGGFIEPLESTGIFLAERGISYLLKYFPDQGFNPVLQDTFNHFMAESYQEVLNFIVLHYYLTERDDTDFWRAVRSDTVLPPMLEQYLDVWKVRLPHTSDYGESEHSLFRINSYHAILEGMGHLPQAALPELAFKSKRVNNIMSHMFNVAEQERIQVLTAYPNHYKFLYKRKMMYEEHLGML